MDPLGDPLRTRTIQTGKEMPIEPYPNRQFGFINNPNCQFGDCLVRTWTQTRSDGPELLLTLLQPPTVRPRSHFSFCLSLLLALCYPFHGLCEHVRDPGPSHLVVLVAGVPLLLSLLYQRHHCQPQCLLAGCPAFHQVCEVSSCSGQVRQFLSLLSSCPLNAAPSVAGGRWGFAPPSPFSVLVSVHRLNYGCARSLGGDGCQLPSPSSSPRP